MFVLNLLVCFGAYAQINVESFGAVADGHTDNSRAIQSAIDATKPGRKLIFPCTAGSRYVVKSPLQFGKLIYAAIEGNAPGCYLYYAGTGPERAAFNFVGAEKVNVYRMDFFADQAAPPQAVLLLGRRDVETASAELKFVDVRVEGYASKALVYSIGSEEDTWLGPSFYLNGGGALYVFYTSVADDLNVANLPGEGSSNLSIWMQNFHISDYSPATNPDHVLVFDAGSDSSTGNHTFRDGYMSSKDGTAFAFSSAPGHIAWMSLTVDSIRFESGSRMFDFRGGGSFGNITLTNNKSAGVSKYLIYLPTSCHQCTFLANTVQQGDAAKSVGLPR